MGLVKLGAKGIHSNNNHCPVTGYKLWIIGNTALTWRISDKNFVQQVYFLQAWTVIKFVFQAASTLENTEGEQQALHKISTSWNLPFIVCQVIWLAPLKQDNIAAKLGKMLRSYCSSTNPNNVQPIMSF